MIRCYLFKRSFAPTGEFVGPLSGSCRRRRRCQARGSFLSEIFCPLFSGDATGGQLGRLSIGPHKQQMQLPIEVVFSLDGNEAKDAEDRIGGLIDSALRPLLRSNVAHSRSQEREKSQDSCRRRLKGNTQLSSTRARRHTN